MKPNGPRRSRSVGHMGNVGLIMLSTCAYALRWNSYCEPWAGNDATNCGTYPDCGGTCIIRDFAGDVTGVGCGGICQFLLGGMISSLQSLETKYTMRETPCGARSEEIRKLE